MATIMDGPSATAICRAMRPNRKGTKFSFQLTQPGDIWHQYKYIPIDLEILGILHNPDQDYTGWIMSVRFPEVGVVKIRYNPHTRIGVLLAEEDAVTN